ncbi:MAG: YicC family protein, partial [Clostridium sp.]|nr:YicC family protein [Clostridium sp.]
MIKSMTGFGRGVAEDEKRSFRVEMRGVNHRYLDLNLRMPKSLMSLEEKMKKIISGSVSRGKIDVFITYQNFSKEDQVVLYNHDLARQYVDVLEQMAKEYTLDGKPSISLLTAFPDVLYTKEKEENEEEIWGLLEKALVDSVASMVEMKVREGKALKLDLLEKAKTIRTYMEMIKVMDKEVIPKYKERLEERIASLLETIPVDENRLALEIAMYTDKASIDEEITRLNSHMNQMEKFLEEDEPVGRKLDFLAQEMDREANTIASKSV